MDTPFGKLQVGTYNYILIDYILGHCYAMVYKTLHVSKVQTLTENRILKYWMNEVDRAIALKKRVYRNNIDRSTHYAINRELQEFLLDLNIQFKDILTFYNERNSRINEIQDE